MIKRPSRLQQRRDVRQGICSQDTPDKETGIKRKKKKQVYEANIPDRHGHRIDASLSLTDTRWQSPTPERQENDGGKGRKRQAEWGGWWGPIVGVVDSPTCTD